MITRMFPSPMQLFTHGLSPSSRCVGSGCAAIKATLEHIQCTCLAVKEACIAVHHRIWAVVFESIQKSPGRGQHFNEATIHDMCDHIQSVAGIAISEMEPTAFYDPKQKLTRTLTWEELQPERPDGHSIFKSRKLVIIHENTRGSDTLVGFVERLSTFKRDWYLPWLTHLRSQMEPHGWKVEQSDWITGFRGSIPISLWTSSFDLLRLRPALRDPLLHHVFSEVMEGGVEVLLAYKANQRLQHAVMRGDA